MVENAGYMWRVNAALGLGFLNHLLAGAAKPKPRSLPKPLTTTVTWLLERAVKWKAGLLSAYLAFILGEVILPFFGLVFLTVK